MAQLVRIIADHVLSGLPKKLKPSLKEYNNHVIIYTEVKIEHLYEKKIAEHFACISILQEDEKTIMMSYTSIYNRFRKCKVNILSKSMFITIDKFVNGYNNMYSMYAK